MTLANVAEILLVDDSPTDRLLTTRALANASIRSRVSVVENGVEALSFLRREGRHAHAPRPQLVLLDLNMPRKGGREVLAEMKADPSLRSIPVVVLTTTDSEEDIAHAYNLNANCLVSKPLDYQVFAERIQKIADFWFATVKLPTRI